MSFASENVSEETYDRRSILVIMDIRMPMLYGVGAVDKLADTDSDVKIILMTGDPTSLRAAYKRCPDVFTIIIDDSMVSILSMSNDMLARTITWTT